MPDDPRPEVSAAQTRVGVPLRLLAFMHRTDGSLQSRAVRSGAWVAVASAGGAVLMFVRGIVLARLLPPEVFGVMALALMATRFIESFTETGFGAALIHRQDRFEDARDTAFTMMFLRGLGLLYCVPSLHRGWQGSTSNLP